MKKLLLVLLLSLSSSSFGACSTFWSEIYYPDYLLVEDAYGVCKKVINPNANPSNSYSGVCACPYDTASDGSRCGARSAWSRSGGASPKCDISSIRNQNAIDLANTPRAGMMQNSISIGKSQGDAYEAAGEAIVNLFTTIFSSGSSKSSGSSTSSKKVPSNARFSYHVSGFTCNPGYKRLNNRSCVRKNN